MKDTSEPSVNADSRQRSDKFLNFLLGGEYYGIPLEKVREINGLMKVTRIPNVSPSVRGIINLRGKIIPVVDLRVRFGFDHYQDTERTCIVVVQTGHDRQVVTVGMIVDEVNEVLSLAPEQIEEAPDLAADNSPGMILGIGKTAGKVVLLLDVDRLTCVDDSLALDETALTAS